MLKVIKNEHGVSLESDTEMVSFKELQSIMPELIMYAKELAELSLLQTMPEDLKEYLLYLKTKELISRFFAFFFAGVAIYCILKLYGVL